MLTSWGVKGVEAVQRPVQLRFSSVILRRDDSAKLAERPAARLAPEIRVNLACSQTTFSVRRLLHRLRTLRENPA